MGFVEVRDGWDKVNKGVTRALVRRELVRREILCRVREFLSKMRQTDY